MLKIKEINPPCLTVHTQTQLGLHGIKAEAYYKREEKKEDER